MRRGCSKSENFPQNNECLALNANNYKARECVETCRDLGAAGCNNGTEIFNQFAGDNVDKCRTCSDHIFGNQASKDCAKSESTSQDCPIYAKQGCFSSRVVYDTNMDQESDTYHGCSAFRTSNDEKSCFNVNVEDQFGQASDQKTTCKESCTTDDCNQDVTEIIDGPQSDHFCAVCTVRMDHFNNTIGEGDPRCWGEDIPSQFYTRCDEGLNFCVTDIEVDWAANGDQVTTLKRGCAAEPAPTECRSGAIQTWQYKDCSTTCSNNLLTACNVNMYDTALLFSDNSWGFDKTCFNCETHTGSPHPNDCGPNDGPIGGPESSRNIVKCPKYADHGCFTSILQHEENGEMIEDVIRGCSAFPQEYACSGWTERQLNDNGITTGSIEWNSCKEACSDSNNCNREQAVIAGDNRCYACTAQVDSHGDVYGIGQEFCFSNDLTSADESLIVDCGKDSYCLTDMEVDWYPQGEQITTIRRRCASEEIVNNCETSIANGWAMKDCYTTCEGALCNKDLEVAKLLSEQNVAECYSCKFTELSGSAHNDTMDCKTSPSEETIQACPIWASSACFVADAVVKDEQGDDLVNIYRGCSTFSPDQFGPMMKCSTITVDVGVDTNQPYRAQASTCKQLCSDGDDCNNIRYPDWQPPAEDECPPCEDGALATFFSLLFLLVLIL